MLSLLWVFGQGELDFCKKVGKVKFHAKSPSS